MASEQISGSEVEEIELTDVEKGVSLHLQIRNQVSRYYCSFVCLKECVCYLNLQLNIIYEPLRQSDWLLTKRSTRKS